MYRMVCRVCGMSVLLSAVGASALAAGIGIVVDVVNEGFRTPPGAEERLAIPADELAQGEALRTGVESTIQVEFADGSELSMEPESEILLSDYVFEPGGGADGTIQLGEGLFHFNSNDAADSGIELKTPVATIGIRGTEFLVTVANGATIVDIVEGAVEVTPSGGGEAVTCEGGQSILVAAADIDAVCGDFGSFSTAAGIPAGPSLAQGRNGDGNAGDSSSGGGSAGGSSGGGSSGGGTSGGGTSGGGSSGGGSSGGGTSGGGSSGGGTSGGGSSGGKTNHSGLGDGTNPGKGHGNGNGNGNGNGGGNGGENNPGGGK